MARLRLVRGQTSWWVVRVGSVTWLRPFAGPVGAEHRSGRIGVNAEHDGWVKQRSFRAEELVSSK